MGLTLRLFKNDRMDDSSVYRATLIRLISTNELVKLLRKLENITSAKRTMRIAKKRSLGFFGEMSLVAGVNWVIDQ